MKPEGGPLDSLFTRGLDGDRTAYREFLSELSTLLRAYIRRQLFEGPRGADGVEDVLQEALLAIHARRHTHDRAVPVLAWAYAIARYKLIDFLRMMRASKAEIPLDLAADIADDDGERIEAAVTIRTIIPMLPARYRIPIELTKIEGLSVVEAATLTGMSEATVKVNVHRGMKMLARMLK